VSASYVLNEGTDKLIRFYDSKAVTVPLIPRPSFNQAFGLASYSVPCGRQLQTQRHVTDTTFGTGTINETLVWVTNHSD
jgi:hypothetical protein